MVHINNRIEIPQAMEFYKFINIHDVIPIKDLFDDNGSPTTPYFLASGQKPAVKHFRVFGCPAIFNRYEVSDDGKRVQNKYT